MRKPFGKCEFLPITHSDQTCVFPFFSSFAWFVARLSPCRSPRCFRLRWLFTRRLFGGLSLASTSSWARRMGSRFPLRHGRCSLVKESLSVSEPSVDLYPQPCLSLPVSVLSNEEQTIDNLVGSMVRQALSFLSTSLIPTQNKSQRRCSYHQISLGSGLPKSSSAYEEHRSPRLQSRVRARPPKLAAVSEGNSGLLTGPHRRTLHLSFKFMCGGQAKSTAVCARKRRPACRSGRRAFTISVALLCC
jgi:hypothetical protein